MTLSSAFCAECGADGGKPHDPGCRFSATATSAQGVQSAGSQAYKPVLQLSEEEMQELVRQADQWVQDPTGLSEWALRNYLVVSQLVAKIATTIPGGRGGPNAMLRAAKMYGEFAERAMQLASSAQEKDKVKK